MSTGLLAMAGLPLTLLVRCPAMTPHGTRSSFTVASFPRRLNLRSTLERWKHRCTIPGHAGQKDRSGGSCSWRQGSTKNS